MSTIGSRSGASRARPDFEELAGYADDGNTPKSEKWRTPPAPPKLVLEAVPLSRDDRGRLVARINDDSEAEELECDALIYFYAEYMPIDDCEIVVDGESCRVTGTIGDDNALQRPLTLRLEIAPHGLGDVGPLESDA